MLNYYLVMSYAEFLNQARAGQILSAKCVYVCLSVCVSAPKASNNQWRDMA